MHIGVVLPTGDDWSDLLALARAAEEAGADSVWVPDVFAGGAIDTLTAVAALASSTERVEVGAHMLSPSLRDPAMLARTVGSLELVAPDRVRILFGTGWHRADYESLGRDFPSPDERVEHTRSAVAALKERTSVSVEVAGVRDDQLRLAATTDGWSISADALDAFYERIAFLERACEDVGRTLGDLRVSGAIRCSDDAAARVAELAEHGLDELHVPAPGEPSDLGRLIATVGYPTTARSTCG